METQALEMLYRIDERVKNLASDIAEDRAESKTRERERDAELKDVRAELDSLRLSRAKVWGGAAALSGAMSLAVKALWK